MKKLGKVGLVLGGYIAAWMAAMAAVYVRIILTKNDPGAQASAGMYAFGDFLLGCAVFGILALVPTGLGLYFLRPYRKFWTVFSAVALALAVAGPVIAASTSLLNPAGVLSNLLWLGQMLGSPLLALAFLIFAALAPLPHSRWILLSAAFLEGVVGVYAFVCLFLLGHWVM